MITRFRLGLTVALLTVTGLLLGAVQPSAVRADDVISLVAENNWFPYSAERQGVAEGFAVDLVRAAYHAAGREVKFVNQPYARCLAEVASGRELGCFDTARGPRTEAQFLFHEVPLFSATIVIIAAADSPAHDMTSADLQGQHVAVTNGYTYDTYDGSFQNDKTIQRDVVISDLSLLRVVGLKRVPYGIIYDKVMASLIAEHADELAGKVKIVGVLSHPDLYVSFSKARPDSAAALEALDRGLKMIKADGTYESIERRWADRFTLTDAP